MVETFRALAEPNRLQIVNLLLRQPLTVNEVAEQLGIRQPQASKHLKALSDCGLVRVHRDAQWRIYQLRPEPLQELDVWLGRYRRLWEAQFVKLDDVLEEMKKR